MTRTRTALAAITALAAAAAVAVPAAAGTDGRGPDGEGPPGLVRAAAAAGEAGGLAAGLVAEAGRSGPQGVGSESFRARHAALAEAHADRPGNAAAVHAALARGESPSTVAPGRDPGRVPPGQDPDRVPPGQARKAEAVADDLRRGLGAPDPAEG